MHYLADLQSVHGFRCYDNIASNAKCQRVLVLAVCLVRFVPILKSRKFYGNDQRCVEQTNIVEPARYCARL